MICPALFYNIWRRIKYGFDGECFSYSVYFDSSTAEEMLADVEAAMEDAVDAFGGVEPEDNNAAINEGSGFDF